MRTSPVSIPVEKYLPIPFVPHGRDFSGVDCWGLIDLIYRQEFGITLPAYGADVGDVHQARAVGPAMQAAQARSWITVASPQAGDVVLFRTGPLPAHVGIYLKDKIMLHAMKDIGVAVERFTAPLWARRLLGFYRYHE